MRTAHLTPLALLTQLMVCACGPPSSHEPGSSSVGGASVAGGGESLSSGGAPSSGAEPSSGGVTTQAGGTGATSPVSCDASTVGRAPLRRLTSFEYKNTLRSLLDLTDNPGDSLPPELSGNGFGNDADAQPVSSFLAEQYDALAAKVSDQVVKTPASLSKFASCAATAAGVSDAACVREFVQKLASSAYRRPATTDELDELVLLHETLLPLGDARAALSGVIQAILESPDFLYRIEYGEPAPAPSAPRPLTDHEVATRLSYFFWASPPDDKLLEAAAKGALSTASGVAVEAERLLGDPRSRAVIQFFFDHLLPIQGLTDLARDEAQYPTFSPQIGALMHEETTRFLEYEIFEGGGSWPSVLTAPYSFLNGPLAAYYGISGVTGDEFRKVDLNPLQRKGLLLQGSVLTGTTVSNFTNPVRRGAFLLRNILCEELPDPPEAVAASVVPPSPDSAKTGRQRYSAHSDGGVCAECHAVMDPPGFALENFDAVGLWRDQENGETIDASGQIAALPGPFSGPLDLVDQLAQSPKTPDCFAAKWLSFASGRSLSDEDACNLQHLQDEFRTANYDIADLLVRIATSPSFLNLPPGEAQP